MKKKHFFRDFHFIELDEDLIDMIRMTQNPFESCRVIKVKIKHNDFCLNWLKLAKKVEIFEKNKYKYKVDHSFGQLYIV